MELDKWTDEYEVEVPIEGRKRVFATISTPCLNTGESARRALGPILCVLLAGMDLARVIAAKGEKWDLLTELLAAFHSKDPSARQTELQTFVARRWVSQRLPDGFATEPEVQNKLLFRKNSCLFDLRTHDINADPEVMLSNAERTNQWLKQFDYSVCILEYTGIKDDISMKTAWENLWGTTPTKRIPLRFLLPISLQLFYFPKGTNLKHLPEIDQRGQGWSRPDDSKRKSNQFTLKLRVPNLHYMSSYKYCAWFNPKPLDTAFSPELQNKKQPAMQDNAQPVIQDNAQPVIQDNAQPVMQDNNQTTIQK